MTDSTERQMYKLYDKNDLLLLVSDIHRTRNYGFTASIRPITAHERTTLFKSLSEVIIEISGNTRGPEQAFVLLFADGLFRGFLRLQRRLVEFLPCERCYSEFAQFSCVKYTT